MPSRPVQPLRKRTELSYFPLAMRTELSYLLVIGNEEGEMNSSQMERYLKSLGIIVKKKPRTSHRLLINPENGKTSELPYHGGSQQIGTWLRNKIMKDLGLD